MKYLLLATTLLATFITNAQLVVKPAPLVSIETQDNFFELISRHCGKAFQGNVAIDTAESKFFKDKPLVMHVRKCSPHELQIPFHIGDDASRTWIITKTGSGLSLKHDHRHKDGSYDAQTMYGGHTQDAGWDHVQSFPADQYTKELFTKQGIPQSNENIWQVFVYPDRFSYRLIRQGREFKVDFDLTNPIDHPSTPWGYADN